MVVYSQRSEGRNSNYICILNMDMNMNIRMVDAYQVSGCVAVRVHL